jgi:hypothetical protein
LLSARKFALRKAGVFQFSCELISDLPRNIQSHLAAIVTARSCPEDIVT